MGPAGGFSRTWSWERVGLSAAVPKDTIPGDARFDHFGLAPDEAVFGCAEELERH